MPRSWRATNTSNDATEHKPLLVTLSLSVPFHGVEEAICFAQNQYQHFNLKVLRRSGEEVVSP